MASSLDTSKPSLSNQIALSTTDNNPPKLAWGGAGLNSIPCEIGSMDPTNQTSKSFKDLMSEDLANDLLIKEEQKVAQSLLCSKENRTDLKQASSSDTSNDLFLAQMLQYEFDKEFDSQLQREEKHLNKNCKLAVSFNKYKVCPSWYGEDSDEDDNPEIDDENRALDSFEEREREDPIIPPCGYTWHNNKIVTKHDSIISGRRNAQRVMNFPPEINTGDGGGFNMQLSNRVYNKLNTSAIKETRRKQRVHDKEEKATAEMALDPKTRLLLFKMVNNGILDTINGIISTGKESAVIHAIGGVYEDQPIPSEVAVKVFKTYLTDFKTRERYIRDDFRFKDRMSKNNNRLTIKLWAEKEFHNLRRLQRAGIASPKPILIKKHVLLMSFIGEDQRAAPKLKHIRLSYEDWCIAYEQVVEAMVTMFQGCHLVHGDMSEYNVLWHEDKCWIIDLGQAVEYTHRNAFRFLLRDCSNILGFFKSKGLTELPTKSELFEKITQINLPDDDSIDQLADFEVSQALLNESLSSSTNDHFEFMWNEIQKEEKNASRYKDTPGEGHASLEDTASDLPEETIQEELEPPTPESKKASKRRGRKAPFQPPLPSGGSEDQEIVQSEAKISSQEAILNKAGKNKKRNNKVKKCVN